MGMEAYVTKEIIITAMVTPKELREIAEQLEDRMSACGPGDELPYRVIHYYVGDNRESFEVRLMHRQE